MLIIIFQLGYLAEDYATTPAIFAATRDLHILNVLIGVLAFGATFTALVRRHWRAICVTICVSLILSTTRIGIESRAFAPLFISIVVLLIAVGTLAPWEGRWQATIGWVGLVCFYLLESSVPGRDPHAFVHWIGLLMVVAVAQANSRLQKGYRRQIADKIAALEAHHRELRNQMEIGDRLAKEREAASQRLAERESTLRKIFDSSLDIIVATRFSDGAYVRVNQQFTTVTGYAPEEALGFPSSHIGLWTDLAQRAEFLRQIESNGCVRNLEQNFRLKDGSIVPFLLNAVPIEIDGERCILTTSRDIRDLKDSQRQVRESEATLRQIFDASLDWINVIDTEADKFVTVNAAFADAFGVTKEQLLAIRPSQTGKLDEPARLEEFAYQLSTHGSVRNFESSHTGPAGRHRDILISSTIITVNSRPHILSFVRDISEIKETERRLRESEEKFRQIFEKSADVVVVGNLDTGAILEVNDQFVKRSGLTREQVIGRTEQDFGFFPDRAARDKFVTTLLTEGHVQNHEVQMKGADAPVPALVSGVRVKLNGQNCGIAVVRNIADIKLAERKLRESEATLRKILESSPDAVCIHDKRGRYVHVNREFERLIGYRREQCIGKTFWELAIWPDRKSADYFASSVSQKR